MPGHDVCAVCKGPIRMDNLYGICNGTVECRRKKAVVKYYRYQELQSFRAREYRRENRDKMNRKDRERYSEQRHREVTYLAWSPGLKLMKIGITTGMKMRFKALKIACPDVVLVGTLPVGRELERYLHAAFTLNRSGGEWFDLGCDPIEAALTILAEVISFCQKRKEWEDSIVAS